MSLVLLKRMCPESVYLAYGECAELLASLQSHALPDARITVAAELHGVGLSLENAKCVLSATPDEEGWYNVGLGVALRALAQLYEGAAPVPTRKPACPVVKLRRQDQELLAGLREDMVESRRAMKELVGEIRRGTQVLNQEFTIDTQLNPSDRMLLFQAIGRAEMLLGCAEQEAPATIDEVPQAQKGGEAEHNNEFNGERGYECHEKSTGETKNDGEQPVAPEPSHSELREKQAPDDWAWAAFEPYEMEQVPHEKPVCNKTVDEWVPNLRFEQTYDDLSDLSSVDGYESPRHKQLKEYANSRRKAKAATGVPSLGAEATLATCSKEEAETAASIRQQLQKTLGNEGAAQLLAQYQSKIMRDRFGRPQRFLVDSAGALVGLAPRKNVAHE